MSNWHFFETDPRIKNREAMQGEFFTTEDLDNQYQALIREAIQNSLDARLDTNRPVVVRISLSAKEHALHPNRSAQYFEGAWGHYFEKRAGLIDPPGEDELCTYLVIEDYNTTGLFGEVREYNRPDEGIKNPFYYFMHAEGQSDKDNENRGRWGIGKFVFPKASRIKSFFVVTVRHDDNKRLLAGQSILKTHKMDGKHYVPDGWYGELQNEKNKLPIEDEEVIENFLKDFRVIRPKDKSGTSIVVPFIELPEKNEDENPISLIDINRYVLKEYFYPIVHDELNIITDVAGEHSEFTARTIVELSRNIPADDTLPKAIELAVWSKGIEEAEILKLPMPSKYNSMKWHNDGFFENVDLETVKKRLENGEKIAVRIPVAVAKKGVSEQISHFDVILSRHPAGNEGRDAGKPIFIREGITIPGVKCRKARGYVSLVIVDDPALAGMLGDAENPAHTEWQSNSENFTGKYKYGKAMIDFVANSVSEFINRIDREDEEEDRTMLMDIFSIPDPNSDKRTPEKKSKSSGREGKDMPDPPPPSPQKYNIVKFADGVRIEGRKEDLEGTYRIAVKFAYDIRRRNPFKGYSKFDFELGKNGIVINGEGSDLLSQPEITDTNALRFDVNGKDFKVEVTGFDENRDLIVAPIAREIESEEI